MPQLLHNTEQKLQLKSPALLLSHCTYVGEEERRYTLSRHLDNHLGSQSALEALAKHLGPLLIFLKWGKASK